MTYQPRNWWACNIATCDREILRTKAEAAGWYVHLVPGERPQVLCPVHRSYVVREDAAARAAGERDER